MKSISLLVVTLQLIISFIEEYYRSEKLFKYIELFNERNPIYLDAIETKQNLNSN